ncbi:hypothetical protein ACEF00_09685 [Streptococcus hyovaginalis]
MEEQRFDEMLRAYKYPLRSFKANPRVNEAEYIKLKSEAKWRNAVCILDYYKYNEQKLFMYENDIQQIRKFVSEYEAKL